MKASRAAEHASAKEASKHADDGPPLDSFRTLHDLQLALSPDCAQ